MESQVAIGPLLYARSSTRETWRFALGVICRDGAPAPTLTMAGASVSAPREVSRAQDLVQFLFDVEVARAGDELRLDYLVEVGDEQHMVNDIVVPAVGHLPRTAFFSCNGCDEPKRMHKLKSPEAVWSTMFSKHRAAGYHLLIGGGDQIYCDAVFAVVEEVARWRQLPYDERLLYPVSEGLIAQLERFYLERYIAHFAAPASRAMFARVPTLMTWDDHEIFDGYGSHDDAYRACPMIQAIFNAASLAFRMVQLGGAAAAPHHLQHLDFDDELRVIALDVRAERTQTQVLSADQRARVIELLESAPVSGHVFVISAVPLVFTNLGFVETGLRFVPGRQEAEDDLRDMWESEAHAGERAWLCMNLLDAARERRARVTVISGDMHVGARGRIGSVRPEHSGPNGAPLFVEQLTSSGIVNLPPGGLMQLLLRALTTEARHEIAENAWTEMRRVSATDELLFERNYLSLEPDPPGRERRVWARWVTAARVLEPPVVLARPKG